MLHLYAWTSAHLAQVRNRYDDVVARRTDENGATVIEYVIIAAAVFLLATGLVVVINRVVNREQAKIT